MFKGTIRLASFNKVCSSFIGRSSLNRQFSTKIAEQINYVSLEKPALRIVKPVEKVAIPHLDVPFCLYRSRPPKADHKGTWIKSKQLKYSCYKLNNVCKIIRGRYLQHAISIVDAMNSKGGKIIRTHIDTFLQGQAKMADSLYEAEKQMPKYYQNFNEWKVVEAYVGKAKGTSVPHIRGRGKINMITRPLCRLNIRLKKVPGVDYFEEVVMGKANPVFAHYLKCMHFTRGSTLRDLRNFSFITTSKGRSYRKQQFRRLAIYLREKYHREKGILLDSSVIHNSLKKHLGARFDITRTRTPEETIYRNNNMTKREHFMEYVDSKFQAKVLGDDVPRNENSLESRQTHYNNEIKKIT